MKILFITSSRIGDAVLSTGLLHYIGQTYTNAKVSVACGPLCTSLFEGCPFVDEVIPLKKQPYNKHWIGLWKRCVGKRWDMVVDLRNSAVSRLIWARRRFIFGPHIDRSTHKVRQAAEVMKLSEIPAPHLWFSDAQNEKATALIPDGDPVIGVGPAANWIGKTWPAERFIEVLGWITAADGVMPNARVAVFAAPGEEAIAQQVLDSIPDGRAIDAIAKTDPGTAAAAIARCDFYLGNDSGLMHCGAAAGIPTVGLFGPSFPHLYSPWGDHAAHAKTPQSFDELIDYPGYTPQTAPCLMETLTVDMVKNTITEFWAKKKAA